MKSTICGALISFRWYFVETTMRAARSSRQKRWPMRSTGVRKNPFSSKRRSPWTAHPSP